MRSAPTPISDLTFFSSIESQWLTNAAAMAHTSPRNQTERSNPNVGGAAHARV